MNKGHVQEVVTDISQAAKIGRLDDALRPAVEAGHLEIVRHLCNESDDVPFARGVALRWAAGARS